jgi:quercetin dioxygenase-like cupin family protein
MKRVTSKDPSSELPELPIKELVTALAPAELSAEQCTRMLDRVLALTQDSSPPQTHTQRAADLHWNRVSPFLEMKILMRDAAAGFQTLLLRMQPGGMLPAHRHQQREEFLVLEGECHIGTHRLSAGDVHVAESGSWHDATTTRTGVTVLIRGEYPDPIQRQASTKAGA